jgi:hypothetical protein
MIREIEILQANIFEKLNIAVLDITKDNECDEYFGYHFKLNQFNIKFRKSKVTPKKIGQFVTLWKRNPETKETEPFEIDDNFDFYIIAAEFNNEYGFFFFPKNILGKNNILRDNTKLGKRGFRVYPDWDIPENQQAKKTKQWQTEFFINFSDHNALEKFKTIFQSNI